MGNRGILHDDRGRLGVSRWRHPSWIACALDFRGRRRKVMSPGRYTELFFHDEAVALAAGHRPCAECRRHDYEAFRDAWQSAIGARPAASEMDRALHAARLVPGTRRQATFPAPLERLPRGTFVLLGTIPHLVAGDHLLPFTEAGYGQPVPRPSGDVTVLTPAPIVEVLQAGYRPAIHPSASEEPCAASAQGS